MTLAVRDAGRGPALLALHGFTGDGSTMAAVFEAVGTSRRVVAPDLVGHGESDAPTSPGAYSMPACVEGLVDLLDALRIERADVVGYSMGGRVALSLAAHAPDRVRSLVGIGASPGLTNAAERSARIAADEALADRVLAIGVEAFVDEWMALPLFASQQRLGAPALAAARVQRLACRAEGLAGSLRGMGTGAMPALHDALRSLGMPVLLVVGDEDAKFRALASDMAKRLPNAEIAVIDEAGHAAHLEQPVRFGEVLREFLARVAPSATEAAT